LVGTLLVCADSLTIHFHLLGRGAAGPSGTRVNPSMGLIAACACALSCAHGKTGVGLLPNPSGVYARPMLLKVPLGPTAPRPSTIAMSERKAA